MSFTLFAIRSLLQAIYYLLFYNTFHLSNNSIKRTCTTKKTDSSESVFLFVPLAIYACASNAVSYAAFVIGSNRTQHTRSKASGNSFRYSSTASTATSAASTSG